MTRTYTRTNLSTMSVRELFSLWWSERWVRGLVLSISPIGFVDAIFTVLLFQVHGPEYEYNPIVRTALSGEWWFVWVIVDILSFIVFAMIAGSYYLHTRRSILGNRISWFVGLIGLRVGLVFYNVALYYGSLQPIFWGFTTGVFSIFLVGGLFSRQRDISWKGFVWYWKSKYHRLHDWILTRRTRKEKQEKTKKVPIQRETLDVKGMLLRRAGFLSMAILVFISVPFVLTSLAIVTGGFLWTDIYGSGFYWNRLAGQTFVAGFFATVILFGIMMYFMLRAFGEGKSTTEGPW